MELSGDLVQISGDIRQSTGDLEDVTSDFKQFSFYEITGLQLFCAYFQRQFVPCFTIVGGHGIILVSRLLEYSLTKTLRELRYENYSSNRTTRARSILDAETAFVSLGVNPIGKLASTVCNSCPNFHLTTYSWLSAGLHCTKHACLEGKLTQPNVSHRLTNFLKKAIIQKYLIFQGRLN